MFYAEFPVSLKLAWEREWRQIPNVALDRDGPDAGTWRVGVDVHGDSSSSVFVMDRALVHGDVDLNVDWCCHKKALVATICMMHLL